MKPLVTLTRIWANQIIRPKQGGANSSMEQRYWSNVLNNRIGRRRAMVATGATALGAAFLAACGGGDSGGSSGGSKESNSLVAKPVDTSKQAKKGGVLKDRNFGDPPSLDVIQATVSWNPFGFG